MFVTMQIMDGVESFSFIPRVKLYIQNRLPNLQLSFHCKDKYRDNGFHTLPPGKVYTFGFAVTPFIINRPCKVYRSHSDCFSWPIKGEHELQGRKTLLISNTSTQQESPFALKPLHSHGRD
ncbi:hypothetical protein Lal_00006008 [Lupinus albus]|nr:hypothetical protein Lal_00006008 [Lupinus albus]